MPGSGQRALFTLLLICLQWASLPVANASSDDAPTASDLTIRTTPAELLGAEQAAHYAKILDPDAAVSWEVHLPTNEASEPPGVFVYISPTNSGQLDPRWREVMDRQNLIYIAANDSGNRKYTNRRMVLATLAVQALAQQHRFRADQIVVAGFSGGGRVASLVASQYPEAFSGALYICGVNFWKKSQTPNVERVIRNRFVFLTGSRDFNQRETRRVYRRYVEAGAQNSKLMEITGMTHELPDAATLDEALQYLLAD